MRRYRQKHPLTHQVIFMFHKIFFFKTKWQFIKIAHNYFLFFIFMFLLVLYENTLPFLKNKTHIHNAHSYEKHVISIQDYR